MRGRTVAITRSKSDSIEFAALVKAHGASTIPLDIVQLKPAGQHTGQRFLELLRNERYDYCAFVSPRSVSIMFKMLDSAELIKALGSTTIIAIGPKTRDVLEDKGIPKVMLPPNEYSSRGLVKMLEGQHPKGKKIIIPRSAEADEFLARSLNDIGMNVAEINTYGVIPQAPSRDWIRFAEKLMAGKIDAVVFTSASRVNAFFNILSRLRKQLKPTSINDDSKYTIAYALSRTKVISIGPLTSATLARIGVGEYYEAKEHTISGIVDLMVSIF